MSHQDHFKVHPLVNGCQLELRGIRLNSREAPYIQFFHPDQYKSAHALKVNFYHRALQINRAGYTCYTPLNPIRADYEPEPGRGTNASGILRYDEMMVDLDRTTKLGKKNPASDDELKRALELSNNVSDYMNSMHDWGHPHRVMTGNGYHLYYHINLPNNEETSELVGAALATLAEKFNSDDFEIDTVVFDPARITKVIGTRAIKGQQSQDRPWREVVLCD